MNTIETEARLMGTWRCDHGITTHPDGRPIFEMLGGFLTLSSNHRAHVLVTCRMSSAPGETTCVGYYGRWSADDHGGTMTIEVEDSTIPDWRGRQMVRSVRFMDAGQRLELTATLAGPVDDDRDWRGARVLANWTRMA